jgi:NDP-sugar pyrophosphorylase family protein
MIKDRPFLDILLGVLSRSGQVKKAVLAVGYMADIIIRHYSAREDIGLEIEFSVEKTPLGTGGAARKALERTGTEEVLVMNGDSFAEVGIDALIKAHRKGGTPATMVVARVEDASRHGRVDLGPGGEVRSFEGKDAKPFPGFINAGVYIFRRDVLAGIPAERPVSLEREVLPGLLEEGIRGFAAEGKFIDIGIPEDYERAQTLLEEFCQ